MDQHSVTKSVYSIVFILVTVLVLSTMFFVSSYFSITLPPTIVAIVISYFIHSISKTKRNSSIPPGPISIPIFGNWLQVGNDLNHRFLASLSQTYGSICLLKLGSKNLTVVSSPELANQVLHTQGVEFGSCPRNVVFDIFTGNGQDMVFTTYGEHWRKMRRIMTLQKLPYLQATVKETLRLHTPIPLLVPHMNLEEAKLGGYTVPRESKVVVNAWWLANNPEWWKGPEEFRPERFLEEECLTDVAVGGGKVDFRYLPFGMGRRSCPGIILALPILGLIIAKLVTNFEMKAPQGIGKIDLKEKGGQFSLHLANHSTVVFDPIITRA